MAMTLNEIENLMKKKELRYFVDPDRPRLMFGFRGLCGTYQFLIVLELDGQFLQFRTADYHRCGPDHPHLKEVLKVLGAINYKMRLAKFGWDPTDGEIVVYADAWLMDGKLTWEQFKRMMNNYLGMADTQFGRIDKTIETGKDPGQLDPETILRQMKMLPPELKKLLEKMKGKKTDEGPDVTHI